MSKVTALHGKRTRKEILENNPEKWNYPQHKDEEFWYQDRGVFVKLTPDCSLVPGGGMKYHVRDVQTGRVFVVSALDIVLASDKVAKIPQLEDGKLAINISNYEQIKTYLLMYFVPSYSWSSKGEIPASEIKRRWEENIANAANSGNLVRLILDIRKIGIFINRDDFIEKTKQLKLDFPFATLVEFLKFEETEI